MEISFANMEMRDQLKRVHLAVTAIPGGLIRQPYEITDEYIENVITAGTSHGLMLVAKEGEEVIGEIHAYTPQLFAFQHLLTDLTIVVHPDHQGKHVGRKLFERFLEIVENDYPHILRVKLYVRKHNTRNVQFYKSLGFETEGVHERKIYTGPAQFETPQQMVWINTGYTGAGQ